MRETFEFTDEQVKYLKENWGKVSIASMTKTFNCTRKRIEEKAEELNLPKLPSKIWSVEEKLELKELWGTMSFKSIAKRLNRTEDAIRQKGYKMNLGNPFAANGLYLKISDVSRELDVDQLRIRRSWIAKGLKVHAVKFKEKSILGIKIDELFSFLEVNQDLFDASKLEENILGEEPKWLKEKRKRDYQNPPIKKFRRWTDEERCILRLLLAQGKTHAEIGKRLNRKTKSVSDEIQKQNLTLSIIWQPDEEDVLKANFESGFAMSYEKLAYELGRGVTGVMKRCRTMGYNQKNAQNNSNQKV
ncbi:MAG: helix-turn-helix domain-containing protein [Bacilli bacterium]|nr:helix-turn-helix domain-containing protein [Bacilli bacterium]